MGFKDEHEVPGIRRCRNHRDKYHDHMVDQGRLASTKPDA
jgi:hypothetical protein